MVWKRILLNIGLFALKLGLKLFYRYADRNKDGTISKKEWNKLYDDVKKLITN